MQDDDKDKSFEGQEESEYHYSDDEETYEVEPEPEKPRAEVQEERPQVSFLTRLSQSKRMLISGAVFLLLIFVVYKMVTPTATTPSTDITVATAPKQMPSSPPTTPKAQGEAPSPTMQRAPATGVTTLSTKETVPPVAPAQSMTPGAPAQSITPPVASSSPAQQAMTPAMSPGIQQVPPGSAPPGGTPSPTIAQGATQPTNLPQPPASQASSMAGAPMEVGQGLPAAPQFQSQGLPQSSQLPAPGGAPGNVTTTTVAAQEKAPLQREMSALPMQGMPPPGGSTQPALAQPTPSGQTFPQAPRIAIQPSMEGRVVGIQNQIPRQQEPVSMPAIIPVQAPIPTTVATVQLPTMPPPPPASSPRLTQSGALQTPLPEKSQTELLSLQARSEQLMAQLEADYSRKIDEYASQNRVLQDQIQNLNAKVAGVESQLTQLLQALMRPAPPPPQPAVPKEPPVAVVEQRITYNVQAIIPGRAWLKSASGETVTVAEGDVVRDLGRITKIDPYDGVVEINTGSKVVALSYGNGG